MDTYEIRRKNLHQLIAKYEGPANLSRRLRHKGTSYLSQLSVGRRPITEKTAREIEKELRLPHGWFDLPGDGREIAAIALPPLDAEKLKAAIARVLMDPTGRSLAPDGVAEVVAYVYQEMLREHDVDVAGLLKLLKR